MARLAAACALLVVVGCGGAPARPVVVAAPRAEPAIVVAEPAPAPPPVAWVDPYQAAIESAKRDAAPGGRRVLDAADAMVTEDVVVVGSCWSWTSAVFERAGGTSQEVFRGRQAGPWADPTAIRAGDWLYFVHGEGGGTHSAIFVAWIDESAHVALTVSYVGGRREESARYSTYDLSHVYRIVRMTD